MKVLHVTTSYPLYSNSFSGIFIYRLISAMPDSVESAVLTPDGPGCTYKAYENIQIFPVRYGRKKWQKISHEPGGIPAAVKRSYLNYFLAAIMFLCMFIKILKISKKFDIIHAHWTINGFVSILAGTVTKVPVVTSFRGEDVNKLTNGLVGSWIGKFCVNYSRKCIVVSEGMKDKLLKLSNQNGYKIHCLHNGIDEKYFSIKKNYSNDHDLILLTLGSLVQVKGIDLIIRALSLVECKKKVSLIIAGDGPLLTSLKQLAKECKIEDRVVFIGMVDPEKIFDLMQQADIYVQASYREGRPNSVVEAMASGIAVVGSSIDGIKPLLQNGTGLMFSSGDAEDLSKKLQKLLDSSSFREKLAVSSRKFVKKSGFSWTECASNHVEIYRSSIN